MLSLRQFRVRVFYAFIVGFLLTCLPLTLLKVDAIAQTSTDVETLSANIVPTGARDLSFSWKDYTVEHQWMENKVNIAVDLTLKEDELTIRTEDPTLLFERITQFLVEYPNEDDYWETVNRRLTKTLLQEHPELRSLVISLEILPRSRIPYTCTSIVTANDQNQTIETWQFLSNDVSVRHQGRDQVNLSVRYTYKSEITAQEYPDFVPIEHQIAEILRTYSHPLDSWEAIDRQLVESILAEHSTLTDVTVALEALPTPELPYISTTSVLMTRLQTGG